MRRVSLWYKYRSFYSCGCRRYGITRRMNHRVIPYIILRYNPPCEFFELNNIVVRQLIFAQYCTICFFNFPLSNSTSKKQFLCISLSWYKDKYKS